MQTKVTLTMDANVIQRAKQYASSQNTSLSRLVESYLDSITRTNPVMTKIVITPLVESLTGVIDLPNWFEPEREYYDYLEKKHR